MVWCEQLSGQVWAISDQVRARKWSGASQSVVRSERTSEQVSALGMRSERVGWEEGDEEWAERKMAKGATGDQAGGEEGGSARHETHLL